MLSTAAITAGLQTWWRDHLPITLPTIYPGTQLDTTTIPAWCELYIDLWTRPPRRSTNIDALHIAVTIHLFAKGTHDRTLLPTLIDAATAMLQHQRIPLHDPTLSESPLTGYALLHEAQSRNLTRPQQPHAGDHLQHIVVTIEGRAEELSSGP
jgi:hypothetical protein